MTAIDAQSTTTCAIANRRLWCWGAWGEDNGVNNLAHPRPFRLE